MQIYKTYKFRMYPNNKTKEKLNSFMGTSRFIYNYFLDKKSKMYNESNINYPLKDMKSDVKYLKVDYPWLKEIDSTILRTSLDDLDTSFTNFFEKRSNYPKFKKKNNHDTYRTNAIRNSYKDNNYCNIKVDLDRKMIKLPKLSEIKIRGYRNLLTFDDKKIVNCTISKDADRYYVSILTEENIKDKTFTLNRAVGIDIGIKNLVITSDGEKYQAMKKIQSYEKRIKGLNKALARKEKGSKNRYKLIIKIQRAYQKLRNARKYYTDLISKEITDNYSLVAVEDLNVQNMINEAGNKSFRKIIYDSTFNELIRKIEYKCKWKQKKIIKVNRYYKSSQICSHCGFINKETKNLSIRKWECPNCHNENDRDLNASINILWEGIKKYLKENSNLINEKYAI